MFPLLFQLIILICDYTLDKVQSNNDKKDIYEKIKEKQEQMLQKIENYENNKNEIYRELYDDLLSLIKTDLQ